MSQLMYKIQLASSYLFIELSVILWICEPFRGYFLCLQTSLQWLGLMFQILSRFQRASYLRAEMIEAFTALKLNLFIAKVSNRCQKYEICSSLVSATRKNAFEERF